jgi:uncharacterized protein (TIGR01777 family)
MNYLITGGTGFIGSRFIKTLSSKKDFVIILSRKKTGEVNNCRVIDTLSLINNDEKIDCIINLAGKPIDCRWTKANKKELENSRLSVTKSLEDLVERLTVKPKIIVSASAIGFYGDYNNEILDESSIGKKSFTNKLCQEWENAALKLEKYGPRVCIMRLGVVLGQNGGFIKKISLPFKLGLGGNLGNGKQIFSWIHIEDVISAMKFLIENKKCFGIYNFVAPETINNAQITRHIGEIINRPTIFNIPIFLIKIVFGEMGVSLLLQGNKIMPRRLLDQGYIFKYNDARSALNNIGLS